MKKMAHEIQMETGADNTDMVYKTTPGKLRRYINFLAPGPISSRIRPALNMA